MSRQYKHPLRKNIKFLKLKGTCSICQNVAPNIVMLIVAIRRLGSLAVVTAVEYQL
jgi:hypothetical protein